jgi:hypothetical protein
MNFSLISMIGSSQSIRIQAACIGAWKPDLKFRAIIWPEVGKQLD